MGKVQLFVAIVQYSTEYAKEDLESVEEPHSHLR